MRDDFYVVKGCYHSLKVGLGLGPVSSCEADALGVVEYSFSPSDDDVSSYTKDVYPDEFSVGEFYQKYRQRKHNPPLPFIRHFRTRHHMDSADIESSVLCLLTNAYAAKKGSIVIPLLGVGDKMKFSPEVSAQAMCAGTRQFIRLRPQSALSVIFAVEGCADDFTRNTHYLALSSVFRDSGFIPEGTFVSDPRGSLRNLRNKRRGKPRGLSA